ncbi:MAG TPA: hypothetical protein VKQ34_01840, partial [Candidatus Saccharimonadales bacterium]|nr:hypothetical protein [Candidatus Saccharimonadales bacterium]
MTMETFPQDRLPKSISEAPTQSLGRLAESSPECQAIMSKAGDALLNGDYAAAKELTTTLWQIDGDVPSEALPLVEITSAEPCIVTMGEVPPELDYWLQHPDQRLRHSMALGAE